MQKTSSTSNFKLPGAFAAAFLICFLLRFLDLLLPVNAFTHRVWEALIVHQANSPLPGPFYPRQNLAMEEQGDLAPYTRFAVKKQVAWVTNESGYRKTTSAEMDYPIVMVGDSTTLGTGLDQADMISEQLEKIIGKKVYPFAPYYQMDTYLHSSFYKKHPPKQVIFSMMEWALPDLIEAVAPTHQKILSGNETWDIFLDRTSKLSFMRFLNARVKGFIKNTLMKPSFQTAKTAEGWMVFPQGKSAHNEIPLETIQKIIPVLQRYQSELKKRGIEFFFLPVPNKESLYDEWIPGHSGPVFYPALVKASQEAGIPTLDLLTIYEQDQAQNSRLLYHLDDSHWNARGAELAARETARWIQKPEAVS